MIKETLMISKKKKELIELKYVSAEVSTSYFQLTQGLFSVPHFVQIVLFIKANSLRANKNNH